MTNAFSALSLKRNRSASGCSKKESKFNAILNKLASSFYTSSNSNTTSTDNNSNKKRRQQHNRRSSLSIFIDYFRTEDESSSQQQKENNDHPFANDALFEHNRYKQQKKQQQEKKCVLSSIPPLAHHHSTTSILVNNNNNKKNSTIHHRHTNSSPSAINTTTATARRKKSSNHIRHYSHVSCISASNITVNSEDLTAKEFADIAGIRILSEYDDFDMMMDNNEYSYSNKGQKKICTFCGDEENAIMVPSLIVTSRISQSSMIIRDSHTSIYDPPTEEDEDKPQIWDNQFWTKPGDGQQEAAEQTQQMMIEPPPILHELKRNSKHQDTFIKKGRFEIHLTVNNSLPVKKLNPDTVLEWKRKARPTEALKHQFTA